LAFGGVTFDQPGEGVVFEIALCRAQRAGLGLRNGLRSVSHEMIHDALAGGWQLAKRHDLVNEANAARFLESGSEAKGLGRLLNDVGMGCLCLVEVCEQLQFGRLYDR
jgi:hypothetical protein